MTINKLTLAAVLTIGLMAGTMNSGIAGDINISETDTMKIAACPLNGCQNDVTPNTATCPCAPVEEDCGCNTGCAAPCEPCNPCETIAPACGCEPVVDSVCTSQIDGKSMSKQHYAYPANIYSDTQMVGSNANGVIIGENSTCGCPIAPSQGVMVSDLPTCGCNCGEGITTGAASDMPILGGNYLDLDQIITGGAAGINMQANTCPIEMQTSSGMDVIRRTIVPYTPAITGGASPITSASSFEDVPAGYWASCDINLLAENKVIAGYPDRTFKPNLPVSRAEIASMAVNGFNLRSCGCPEKTFKDVPSDHWANQAINTAVANGLMEGYPNNMFKPNKPVTRAEAMVTLAKGIPCEMDNCKAEEILSKFCDGNKVPNWAKIPVAKAIETGALKDVPNGNEIQACKDASRADVASMLEAVRCAMGYSNKDVAYTAPADCGCTGGAAFMAKDEIVTIPTLCLKFEDEINAKHANIGDRFAAKTTESVTINGQTFPAGSTVYGKVTEVDRPTGNCKGGLKLSFERIQCHDCKADLPQQVLTAQVKTDKKPNFFAKLIEMPFSWAGSVVGTVGRTVGGAIIAAGNAVEHVSDGVGLTFGETLQGQLPAAGRSLMDASKALVKAPIDLTRTALSGTMGLLQTTGDEVAYLVDPKGNRITSVNPREHITVAFGCNSCTGCAAPVQPCDCNNNCGCD